MDDHWDFEGLSVLGSWKNFRNNRCGKISAYIRNNLWEKEKLNMLLISYRDLEFLPIHLNH